MKRFLLKFGLFFVTCFALLNVIAVLSNKYSSSPVQNIGFDVYAAIDRSNLATSATTLLIGDSVCRQLSLKNSPPEIFAVASNQAVSMCGQYILAHSVLDHNPGIKEVVLAYQPQVFDNNLMQNYTLNYFVRPFFIHPKYYADMWPMAMQRIFRKPVGTLVLFPLFRDTNLLSDLNYAEGAGLGSYHYVSPISVEYVRRLSALCQQRHVRLRIVSTPISTDRDFSKPLFFKEIADDHLEKEFEGYAESVRYADPSEMVDHVHFKPEYIDANAALFFKMIENESAAGTDKK